MALIEPGRLHRVALVVEDSAAAHDWFKRLLGVGAIDFDRSPANQIDARGDEDDLEGTETRLFRVGGCPFILLSAGVAGGPVASFYAKWGTGVHSLAWEVEDLWTAQNLLIRHGIRIGAVNIPGRHFFMHPRDTHGVLMEWTDDTFGESIRRPDEGRGVVEGAELAWVTAAVKDAPATAALLAELCDAKPVEGNAHGPSDHEVTVDVAIGDITLRLVTPSSDGSRYAGIAADTPRLCSLALRVPDLETALSALAGAGVPVQHRQQDLAFTDPADTCGIPIEWTA